MAVKAPASASAAKIQKQRIPRSAQKWLMVIVAAVARERRRLARSSIRRVFHQPTLAT